MTEALSEIEKTRFDFALLDVNLGSETSERAALELTKTGTPFAFATGYGDAAAILDAFDNPVVVQKPFDKTSLKSGVQAAMDKNA